jgi:hypothetical protein
VRCQKCGAPILAGLSKTGHIEHQPANCLCPKCQSEPEIESDLTNDTESR